MRRRPYSGPPMSSREGTAGLRARLARGGDPHLFKVENVPARLEVVAA